MKLDEIINQTTPRVVDEGLFDVFKKQTDAPERYHPRDDVDGWMERMVAYYKRHHPGEVWQLFCPSSHEYMPMNIHAGLSRVIMQQHMRYYLKLKHQNPEDAQRALRRLYNTSNSSLYNGGPREDYLT